MKKFLHSIGHVAKGHRLASRLLSVLLTLLLIFYVVPPIVYTKAAEAFEGEESTEPPSEIVTSEYEGSPYTYESPVYEVRELREESVKHFRLEDGSYLAAQYPMPVHYYENGELVDIDNSLSSVSGGFFATENARIKFVKKTGGSGEIFKLQDGSTKLTVSLVDAIKKTPGEISSPSSEDGLTELQKMVNLENLTSRIIYRDILEGVDLEYVVESMNIKENVIVKERAEEYTYRFTLELNGLTASFGDKGDILVFEGESIKYTIPAPTVFDSLGVCAPITEAWYTLVDLGNGEYSMAVTVTDEWMNSPDRAFPVTVDPTVAYSNGTITDTYITPLYPNDSEEGSAYLFAAQSYISYWKTTALPIIPSGSYISEASVYFLNIVNGANDITNNKVSAHKVTSNWDDDLTYNDYLNGDGAFSNVSLDYNSPANINYTPRYMKFNITSAVKDWYANNDNYGIALKSLGNYTQAVAFYSSDHPEYAPIFTISYVNMMGFESYWSYNAQSAGFAGSGNLNMATGNLVLSIPTIATSDNIMPFMPTLVYNSSLAGKNYTHQNVQTAHSSSYMPYGFKLNINETVVKKSYVNIENVTSTYFVLADGDGTEHAFYQTAEGSGVYKDEDGLNMKLTLSSNNSTLTITDDTKTTKTFKTMAVPSGNTQIEAAWYLTEITDNFGNSVVFSFNDSLQPTKVCLRLAGTSYSDTLLELFYENGNLVRIYNTGTYWSAVLRYSSTYNSTTFNSGGKYLRQIDFAYASHARGSWATYISTGSASNITTYASAKYEYTSEGLITEIIDCKANQSIDYTFSNGRVQNIKQYAGDTGKLGYRAYCHYYSGYGRIVSPGADAELYTNDDLQEVYIFDSLGRVKKSYTFFGNGPEVFSAVVGQYSEHSELQNKLVEVAVLGNYSANYVLNGDFEETSPTATFTNWDITGQTFRTSSAGLDDDGNYCLNFRPTYGTGVATATQYLFLKNSEYTLSFKYISANCSNTLMWVTVQSTSGSTLSHTEYVSLSKSLGAGALSDFSMTFTVPSNVSFGDNVAITISAITNSSTSVAPNIRIDRVMLGSGSGSSDFNLVSYGAGDSNVHNSYNSQIPFSNYWTHSDGEDALEYGVAHYSPFQTTMLLRGGVSNNGVDDTVYVKQRIYEAPSDLLASYDSSNSGFSTNAKHDYAVGGYAYAEHASYSPLAKFRLRVDVTYYQGNGNDDVTLSYNYDFLPGVTNWQYTGGVFSTKYTPKANDNNDYSCVKAIDLYCEYSGQPNDLAHFANLSVVRINDSSVTRYEYYTEDENKSGLLRAKTNPYYNEYYEYDSARRLTRVANDRGQLTDYFYNDANDSVVRIEEYDFVAIQDQYNTDYPYDSDNPEDQIIKTLRATTSYEYNTRGKVTKTTLEASGITLTEESTYLISQGCNIAGALLTHTATDGQCTTYYYNENNGNLLATVNKALGTGVIYEYGADGTLQIAREAEYDSQEDDYFPKSGGRIIEYRTNDTAQLSEISTGTAAYRMSFDVFGNLTTVDIGYDRLVNYEYYPKNGSLKKITNGEGEGEEYEYNDMGLVSRVYSISATGRSLAYEYEYTSTGQLRRVTDYESAIITEYNYDASGRIRGVYQYEDEVFLNDVRLIINYDDYGNPCNRLYYFAHMSDTPSFVQYMNFYDEKGRITDRDVDSDKVIGSERYTYDVLDRLVSESYVYNVDEDTFRGSLAYTYENGDEATGRISTYTTQINDGTALTYTYTYDTSGRITKIKYSTGEELRYYYDKIGQLIREDNEPLDRTFIYEYDNGGNLTRKEDCYLAAENATPSGMGDYIYGYENMTDKMIEFDQGVITYDDGGNPLNYTYGRTFSWTGTRLTGATSGSKTMSFTYNEDGLRTGKTVNGESTYYYRIGGQLIYEASSDGITAYLYDLHGAPMGFQYLASGDTDYEVFLYEKNLHGDIVAVYDSAGTKLISYLYDAWGNTYVTYHNGASASHTAAKNPFRYRGYYYDADLNLYYLGSRYYDSLSGRFISPDSFEYAGAGGDFNSFNLYAYCGNDPVNYKQRPVSSGGSITDSSLSGTLGGEFMPIINPSSGGSSIFNSVLANGSFRNGLFFGKGTVTGLYASGHTRAQISLKNGKFVLGAFGKFSLLNATGQIGIGNDDFSVSLVGVGDIGTLSAMAGILIDPSKNTYFAGIEAKAAVFTARGGVQFEIFDTQIEVGGSISALSAGFQFGVGIEDGVFCYKSGFAVLFGYDFYIRIKFA